MVTYFEALKAERAFREYRALALMYWSATPKDQRTRLERRLGVSSPETESSRELRAKISRTYPMMTFYAKRMGISVDLTSYPAPAIGGPVIQSSLLFHVIDQDVGYTSLPRADVLDAIDRCIGAAQTLQAKLLWTQALNPLWYVIELLAFIIRIPFIVLRRAGLPDSIEETLWAHIIKVALWLGILLVCAYLGIKVSVGDVMKLFQH